MPHSHHLVERAQLAVQVVVVDEALYQAYHQRFDRVCHLSAHVSVFITSRASERGLVGVNA